MARIRTRSVGATEIQARLAKIAANYPKRVGQAQRAETEIEATECRKRTPVDTNALRSSIHVEGPLYEGRSIRTAIVAGGPSAPYAVIVHEDLEAFHRVGEAKFIERPLNESAPHMAARIGRRVGLKGI